jgi:hypothetical protein
MLHPEGEDIKLPLENEEDLPSMSEGAETEEESPTTLEGVLMFEKT